jgi:hypothetical protein
MSTRMKMMERFFNFTWMELGDRSDRLYSSFLIEVEIQHGLQKSAKFQELSANWFPQMCDRPKEDEHMIH